MSHDIEVWTLYEAESGVVAKLGGIPPIQLIRTVDDRRVKQPSVTIKLAKKTKDTYNKFDGGVPEKSNSPQYGFPQSQPRAPLIPTQISLFSRRKKPLRRRSTSRSAN